jgi:chemotaxis protein methyltransferase CheR
VSAGRISDEARRRLAERLRGEAGLNPPGWLLDARVGDRAAARGVTVEEWVALAVGDGAAAAAERAALVDAVRVGETRFFRHRRQLEVVAARALPERVRSARADGRPLRLWSAGCSSGEEAWTLAMLVDGAVGAEPLDWSLLATDLAEEALAAARAGRYAAAAAGDLPDEARRYLVREGETITVIERLRARVRFERHNLLDRRFPVGMDVIFCRNVLIYFDAETRAQVVARLAEALRPGGYLFVGYSESLRGEAHLFEALSDGEVVLYRRRGGEPTDAQRPRRATPTPVAVVVPPTLKAAPPPPPPIVPARPAPPAGATATEVALAGDYSDGERLSKELRPLLAIAGTAGGEAPPLVVDLDGATYLGDEAARVLGRALRAAPSIRLRATRPGVLRWLERHGLDEVAR